MQNSGKTNIACTVFFLLLHAFSIGQSDNFDKHVNVAMRLIGHELLLDAADSVSLVLPIEQKENLFVINFSDEFYFSVDSLKNTIESILKSSQIAKHYIVEVKNCDSSQVVYSYESSAVELPSEMSLLSASKSLKLLPCGGRVYPSDCYKIYINVLAFYENGSFDIVKEKNQTLVSSSGKLSYTWSFILVGLIIVLIGILLYLRKKKESLVSNNDLIKIGAFTFDIKNTKLTINNEKIELTHKESELLQLLYNNVNATVEKEFILKEVWGDEGDYVGRTLDVFISKLRKKIGPDSLVKIINVRGIGYKLVVND